jgi:hypothetical protein
MKTRCPDVLIEAPPTKALGSELEQSATRSNSVKNARRSGDDPMLTRRGRGVTGLEEAETGSRRDDREGALGLAEDDAGARRNVPRCERAEGVGFPAPSRSPSVGVSRDAGIATRARSHLMGRRAQGFKEDGGLRVSRRQEA